MHSAVNIKLGKKEERPLLLVFSLSFFTDMTYNVNHSTGVHTVADAFCMGCNERLGWFYHKAADPSQKYKEGTSEKFETLLVLTDFPQESTCLNERDWSRRTHGLCMVALIEIEH